jgi:hypothetical protein
MVFVIRNSATRSASSCWTSSPAAIKRSHSLNLLFQAIASLSTASALSLHPLGCQPPLPQTPESAAPAHQPIGPASAKVDILVQRRLAKLPSLRNTKCNNKALLVSSSFISYQKNRYRRQPSPALRAPHRWDAHVGKALLRKSGDSERAKPMGNSTELLV